MHTQLGLASRGSWRRPTASELSNGCAGTWPVRAACMAAWQRTRPSLELPSGVCNTQSTPPCLALRLVASTTAGCRPASVGSCQQAMQHALNDVHVPAPLPQVHCRQSSRCSTPIDAALHRALGCLAVHAAHAVRECGGHYRVADGQQCCSVRQEPVLAALTAADR